MVKTKIRLEQLEEKLNEKLYLLHNDLQLIKQRLMSIESWLAALSKGKDLNKSHTFTKDITDLQERKHPTIGCCEINSSPTR